MFLTMFDVDGTLVRGSGIDDVCFSEAIKGVLGIDQFDTDWSHYLNVSDSGITSEIIENHLSRKATESDIASVRQSYLSRLRVAIGKDFNNLRVTPGARVLITELRLLDSVCISVATGGWRDSALLKLSAVGILLDNIPIASSDDAHERESIMKISYERSAAQAGCKEFQSVLYIGDHPWDYVNSRKLGYKFLGIGSGIQAEELTQAGVTHIMPDLINNDYFFEVLGIPKRQINRL
jgi:phosphoglycolate phosphatase-like HAD superfamily hydrolase